MSRQTLQITGMSCAACQIHVQRALQTVPGVDSANVNLMAHTAQINSSAPIDASTLIQAVRGCGYDATLSVAKDSIEPSADHNHLDMGAKDSNLGLRTLLALMAGGLAMLLSMPLMMDQPASSDPLLATATRVLIPFTPAALMALPQQPIRWVLCVLALATMLFAAPEIYSAALRAAQHRATNMNTLVAIGTLAAFASSLTATVAPTAFTRSGISSDVYYEAVILILAFLLTGRWLEARARIRATAALRGFAHLQPTDARLLHLPANPSAEDYTTAMETRLPLNSIAIGDVLRVLPGDRIPLDAIILHGRSSIDVSMLTGEPLPVTCTINDRVFSGTLNLDGALVIRATAVGAASTLAQIEQLLNDAQSSRAPMQRLADRASAIFVPIVLVLATITFMVWAVATNINGHHEGIAHAFAFAIAVLIIACPCAMGLAVPAAITVSIGRAAQAGLLIKGGEALERLATIDTLAIDKTGTLTLGRPQIAAFIHAPTATLDEPTLLSYAAALERLTTHPLGQAIVDFAALRADLPATPAIDNFRILPGTGLTATISGKTLTIGNASLFDTNAFPILVNPDDIGPATPMYVLFDDALQAAFFATDELRPTAADSVEQLQSLGVRSLLLTGDTAKASIPIAYAAGINGLTDIHTQLLPAQKLERIRDLQSTGQRVAMVGDGINDAAALAQADTGFAMPSGTDLAREAGDILLLHPDLRLLPTAVRLARRTTHIMRQNLYWALVYNAIGLPIAAGLLYPQFHILLSPVLASIAMALSSVSVLANSLRLRRLPSE